MKTCAMTQFIALIAILVYIQMFYCQAFASCDSEECINALACPILSSAVSLSKSEDIVDIIKEHRCGDLESRSICCSALEADLVENNIFLNNSDTNNTVIVLDRLLATPCGFSSGSDRIINGVSAFLYEFPWMALLEFQHNVSEERKFLCSASLISDRYVLTAAHCFITRDAHLVNVRLGEYDTSSEIDCDFAECAPPAQNHEVEDVIIHKDFKTGRVFNDIALIRLKEKAVYGDRILPICLPILKHSMNRTHFATVAGWGLTASGNASEILQKADVPVLSHEFCLKKFPRNFSSYQVCAGGEKGVDTCKGDSGGPLFTRGGKNFQRFVQYGILSGGGTVCGGNNTVPSIYTNVVEYVPWIIENMRP